MQNHLVVTFTSSVRPEKNIWQAIVEQASLTALVNIQQEAVTKTNRTLFYMASNR
jgi:hypothetical protein